MFGLAAAPVLGGTGLGAGILLGLVEYRCEAWATTKNIDAHWWPFLLIAIPLLCRLWAGTGGCWEPPTVATLGRTSTIDAKEFLAAH